MNRALAGYLIACSGAGMVWGAVCALWWFHFPMPVYYFVGMAVGLAGFCVAWEA